MFGILVLELFASDSQFFYMHSRVGHVQDVDALPALPEANEGMEFQLVASLLLIVRPGAPSSVLAPSSDARSP